MIEWLLVGIVSGAFLALWTLHEVKPVRDAFMVLCLQKTVKQELVKVGSGGVQDGSAGNAGIIPKT
jgi:hypothetical protein